MLPKVTDAISRLFSPGGVSEWMNTLAIIILQTHQFFKNQFNIIF